MVCVGLQQSPRMTVNPGRIVAINVIYYIWGSLFAYINDVLQYIYWQLTNRRRGYYGMHGAIY